MEGKKKIIRMSNIPISMDIFCRDLLKELSKDYEVTALSSPGKELDSIREREGVRTIALPMERRISPFKDLASLRRLVKLFRKEKPVMVHSMNPKAGLLGMMAAKIARVPVRVHTFTGLVFPSATGLKRFILKTTDRITCRCATHVIPEGEGVKKDLLAGHITKKPLKVLGYGNIRGVDMDWYGRTPEVLSKAAGLIREDLFTFVFVGRIAADKGVRELVTAFSRLLEKRKDIRLLLVGYSEEDDPIGEDIWKIIDGSEQIVFTGGLVSDVRPYLAASDCLVLPSYREGFPNSPLEAGAMGLPCIVTDINGSNEIITEGENGLIVPVKDTEALYSAMEKMLENRELCRRMGENARPMVASRYSREIVWNSLKEFYREILKDKK